MTRPPKARSLVLDAAERIVRERGAGALTFDELAEASGVTRGGITYHFATKADLLRALLERDLARWTEVEKTLRPALDCTLAADLIGQLRACGSQDSEQARFVAGMLSAIALEPDLMDAVRTHHAKQYTPATWTPGEIRREVLRLAGAGLFWQKVLGCHVLPPEIQQQVLVLLERLALQWSQAAYEDLPISDLPPDQNISP